MNASPLRNVLFVMSDQLRWDHLACNGHPTMRTPNLDALAARSVRFDEAFVQAGVCGPSRMSFYTGRYVGSHGVTWNRVPLPLQQLTLGDYLAGVGRPLHLIGKTHVIPDVTGLRRMGVAPGSEVWRHRAQGGFSEVDRIEGHGPPGAESGYADYLSAQGYTGADPWTDHVVSAQAPDGSQASGWFLRNVHLAARVAEEHSETAYVTSRALDYLAARPSGQPWALHLSYVKPHWPYMAPAPYHQRYSAQDMLPIRKRASELEDPHPVVAAYMQMEESQTFARDEVVRQVRPVYMGLIEQLDHHIGRVIEALRDSGELQHTLIIFTADHGDYGGDHHLGEKDLFHDQVVRVPLMVFDPRPQADATRGHVITSFAEAVDIVPTVLDALQITPPLDRTQGRSLMPWLHGLTPALWRDCVFAEIDYSFRRARLLLDRRPGECRGWMVRERDWKYVRWQGFPPQLFNLLDDPHEYEDLGRDPRLAHVARRLDERLHLWMEAQHPRLTLSDGEVAQRTDKAKEHGIFYGTW